MAFVRFKPYQTKLRNLLPNPLLEMKRGSFERGVCDREGRRLQGAPWAFQLAETTPLCLPKVRTIGFQRVSASGIDYVVLRRRPGARPTLDKGSDAAAIVHVAGVYPSPPGETCEQWRAEGRVSSIPVENMFETVPLWSLAQVLAVERAEVAAGRSADPRRAGLREGEERQRLICQVEQIKQEMQSGDMDAAAVADSIEVCRLLPDRVELSVSSETLWERFEYTRLDEGGTRWDLRRIMPY